MTTDPVTAYYPLLLRIDTPYSMGTGFYWPAARVVVCNEYTVRDNQEVVVSGGGFPRQTVAVVFTDPTHDVAFLAIPEGIVLPNLQLVAKPEPQPDSRVIALGRPGSRAPLQAEGQLLGIAVLHELAYWQHNAQLPPVHSGGLLLTEAGTCLGMIYLNEGLGELDTLALPLSILEKIHQEYLDCDSRIATRCEQCKKVVGDNLKSRRRCPHCNSKVQLPNEVEVYEPVGVSYTIERLLAKIGRDVVLARRGLNQWEINQGSACIRINYHEDSGLITGDALLCQLPPEENKDLYEYLLRQNYRESELTLSVKNDQVLLSLLIYDRYFNIDTALELFRHLFQRADDLDNEIVERFGGQWASSSWEL